LVVIAIICNSGGIAPSCSRQGQGTGEHTACISNLKQIGLSFLIYVDDFRDTFPSGANRAPTLPVREDWIYWNADDFRIVNPARRDPNKAPLTAYLGGFNTNLFRCPSDKEVLKRQRWRDTLPICLVTPPTVSTLRPGMKIAELPRSTPETMVGTSAPCCNFKSTQVRAPAIKLMLVEEHANRQRPLPDDGR